MTESYFHTKGSKGWRQFVPSDNSSRAPILKQRQFVPNCLIDQLINNILQIETKELKK